MSDGKKYSDYVTTVQDYAESNKITFVTTRKITSSSSLEVTNRLLRTTKNGDKEIKKIKNETFWFLWVQYLKDLKAKRVKIIVGEFNEERACEVMCQAYRLNMTAREGYIWFLPNFNSELLQV